MPVSSRTRSRAASRPSPSARSHRSRRSNILGTNGGGFFNANAAHPFENPTPLTNWLLMTLMALLPSALVVCFGHMIGNRRQAWVLYGVMGAMLLLILPITIARSRRALRSCRKREREASQRSPAATWKVRRSGSASPRADVRRVITTVHDRQRERNA